MVKVVKVARFKNSSMFQVSFSDRVPRILGKQGVFSSGWLGEKWIIIAIDELDAYAKAMQHLEEYEKEKKED